MIEGQTIKVLLVEDDEDDFIITRDLINEMPGRHFKLDWARTFEAGLEKMVLNQHDVCLVDYRLGAHNGVDLLRAAIDRGCQSPVILLTGAGEHKIDMQAMQAGAADYLVKTLLQANALERSIRYALQRKRAAAIAAFEQARLAAFGADVGLALTRRDSLEAILQRCARAMEQYLGAGLAQIEAFVPEENCFETLAVAGALLNEDSLSAKRPLVRLDVGPLMAGKPLVIKQLGTDPRVTDLEWTKRENLVSFAAYPLLLEEKLVGIMSVFTQQPLTEQITLEMGSVAHGIALCIERKRSEKALGLSEFKYRKVVESIKEVIFQLDELGNWTFLNPAWTAITGFEVTPTLNTFFLEYICEDDREQNREIFLNFAQRKLDYCRYETRFLTKNGKVCWIEVYAQASLTPEGTLSGISGTLADITDRKTAETQIQKLAAFPRVNPNPVLEFSADGTMTYANDAALAMARSLERTELLSILPPNAGDIARECLQSGQKRLQEPVNINARTLFWSFFPIASSHVVHCYGADVTDVLSLEAQLRHAQKLESVGQLAAGIAHDFNNILTVIQGYSDCLLVRCQGDQVTRGALKQIGDASKRAAALTRQLLTFSRKQVIQLKVLNLNVVLTNLANMLPRLLGEDIVLQTDYASNLPAVEADTGMLEQVVMNLAVNARDAMPRGGKLMIRTASEEITTADSSRHADARAGLFTSLTVTDTGCGMDAKTLERLFEPFFTTKDVGKGTGLGLATVYGIVKQHQGWIEVSSKVGGGSSFKIFLPGVRRPETDSQEDSGFIKKVQGGKETILIVEDEPMLRELVREVLRSYDYEVIEAGSGCEALKIWDQHDGEIDLLLTDMVMPEGQNGRELADQLRQRKPDLKVILSSGYSAEALGRDFAQEEAFFLPKPYLPPQLARIVRECLDSVPRRSADTLLKN